MYMKKVRATVSIVLSFIIIVSEFYMLLTLDSIKKSRLPDNETELGITATPEAENASEGKNDAKDRYANSASSSAGAEYDRPMIENILLFGLDRRGTSGSSRSDTIIVASMDRKNNAVKMISFMRDMYVKIPGKGENRINAAYAFGGPKLAVRTLNSDFGLDVRDFITADFSGFSRIIDLIGGIEINVKANEARYCGVQRPGLQKLNGKEALAFVRIRHVGNADFERTERQRRVLIEILKKMKSVDIFTLTRIIGSAASCTETSLSNAKMLILAADVHRLEPDSIRELRLPADGMYRSDSIDGMSVLVPDIGRNKKLLHEFIYSER